MNEAAAIIYDLVDPNANLIFGTVIDPALEDSVSITIIATGFIGNSSETELAALANKPSAPVRQPLVAASQQQTQPRQAAPLAEDDGGKYPGGIEIPDFLKRRRLQGK